MVSLREGVDGGINEGGVDGGIIEGGGGCTVTS